LIQTGGVIQIGANDEMKKIPIQFTKHAIDRITQIDMSIKEAKDLFKHSKETGISEQHRFYKLIKYGEKYKNIKYYIHRGKKILFTVRIVDKEPLVITVTKKSEFQHGLTP